ncbi:NrfD/PsrC family molybdoenzyme membrane anchor subunit [Bdellovibrionota bacterium FG-1]
MIKDYLIFWGSMIKEAVVGPPRYYVWLAFLFLIFSTGVYFYIDQAMYGLMVTNMSNQVSWGAYIANFTFLVGVAAAAVLLIVPSYLHKSKELKEVVLFGELLALSAILMCLLFIMADLGHPERFMHFTKINFPRSILAWDVIVLNGYLVLNLFIPTYLLFKMYKGEEPNKAIYLPFVFLSIAWAVSIHTVTAFLYAGLGGRPYWNSAILAPRFLISAFAGGPAILMMIFKAISRFAKFTPKPKVFETLTTVMTYTLLTNMFLFACEIYKEFYTDSVHAASAQYLLFGLYGKGMLRPYIWAALIMEAISAVILLLPKLRADWRLMYVACVFTVLGIWIEKGMGLIIPGFIPTPLGNLVEYTPSLHEFFICLGIWAFGGMTYTVLAKICVAIQTGKLRHQGSRPES